MRCMAKINSSAVSFPSWSISERLLKGTVHSLGNALYVCITLDKNEKKGRRTDV